MHMKRSWEDLAIFGGPSAFSDPLHVGRPNIGDRQRLLERFTDMLDRRWLTNDGPYVRELEERIAAFVGVRHCVATCNGTVALEIAVRATGMAGEVIVPSFTFVATPHALQWQGITPVFCDIERCTHNIDPQSVARLITPRTTGIIGVHVWGHACKVQELARLAEAHGLRLIYDAAHAFGCASGGRTIGGFGDAEVFSFHATKFVNAFEGGAVVTNSEDLAATMRLMRNFGFVGYDEVACLGTNGKMTEVAAIMGLASLEGAEAFITTNREHYEHYRRELAGVPGLHVLPYDSADRTNYQYIVVEVDAAETGIGRDDLLRLLWAEQVRARRYFYPGCHRMEPYRSLRPDAGRLLPETERLVRRVLILPTGTAVTTEDIGTVCEIIHLAVAHGGAIAERLQST
jgi:dTDP-4-amino-4,6-dideoxygalactose transaminase